MAILKGKLKMDTLTIFILACAHLGTCIAKQNSVFATPVYGFAGAASATSAGRSLHYTVHLKKCHQLSGPSDPEFALTFGGHVTSWRSFNDREVAPIPYMTFYEQKTIFNDTGNLAQLSREVQLWGNDTAFVTTIIFTADYSRETYMYSHRCSMTSATAKGEVDFEASSDMPMTLNSFQEIVASLESGPSVHFTAMTFLCQGGKEHTFSSFGGTIYNYDLQYDDDAIVELKTSIGQTAYYDAKFDLGVLSIVNMRIFSNATVDIYDDLGVPPEMHRLAVRRSSCSLDVGRPGGMVHMWRHGPSPSNAY